MIRNKRRKEIKWSFDQTRYS